MLQNSQHIDLQGGETINIYGIQNITDKLWIPTVNSISCFIYTTLQKPK